MLQNKQIAWVDGMLVMPQHFEQQERALHTVLYENIKQLNLHSWGFSKCEIDEALLKHNKIRLTACSGWFQDGTHFSADATMLTGLTLDIHNVVADEQLYLGLPLNDYISESKEANKRYYLEEYLVTDAFNANAETTPLLVKQLNLCLLRETDLRDAYLCLPIAKIKTADPDHGIVLDTQFIPPCLNIQTNLTLKQHLEETILLLERKQKQLASSLSAPLQSRMVSTSTDIHVLQIINRYLATLIQYQALDTLHPFKLYEILIQLLAELGTFYREDRLAIIAPIYQHPSPAIGFSKVKQHIIDLLQTKFNHQATALDLERVDDGSYRSKLISENLLHHAAIILCVRSSDETQRHSAQQYLKIAAPEDLPTLIQLQLSGVKTEKLTHVPPQLPFYADAIYLRLINQGERWNNVIAQQSIGLFCNQANHDYAISLWAIPELSGKEK